MVATQHLYITQQRNMTSNINDLTYPQPGHLPWETRHEFQCESCQLHNSVLRCIDDAVRVDINQYQDTREYIKITCEFRLKSYVLGKTTVSQYLLFK
jgi:hypothetical protein